MIIRDYTAILSLAAIGLDGETLKVRERSSFALPLNADAAEKPFKFTGVSDAGAVIIEWEEDGETKSMQIQALSATE